MNQHTTIRINHPTYSYDCPSTCTIDVKHLNDERIGRTHS